MEKIRAIVQKVIPDGKHGPFAVATSGQLDGSITFSLEPTVWRERERPEPGSVVCLEEPRQKRAGWRAKQARFWKPSDEQGAMMPTPTREEIREFLDREAKVIGRLKAAKDNPDDLEAVNEQLAAMPPDIMTQYLMTLWERVPTRLRYIRDALWPMQPFNEKTDLGISFFNTMDAMVRRYRQHRESKADWSYSHSMWRLYDEDLSRFNCRDYSALRRKIHQLVHCWEGDISVRTRIQAGTLYVYFKILL